MSTAEDKWVVIVWDRNEAQGLDDEGDCPSLEIYGDFDTDMDALEYATKKLNLSISENARKPHWRVQEKSPRHDVVTQ